jgi:hypothetical protein
LYAFVHGLRHSTGRSENKQYGQNSGLCFHHLFSFIDQEMALLD